MDLPQSVIKNHIKYYPTTYPDYYSSHFIHFRKLNLNLLQYGVLSKK